MKLFTEKDWKKLLRFEKRENVSSSILDFNLRYGIPPNLRPRLWKFLCSEAFNSIHATDPSFFRTLLNKDVKPEVKDLLRKDIPRTPFENVKNKEFLQKGLYQILSVYSVYNPSIEYVQGMNFIAAGILYNMNPIRYQNLKFSFGKRFANEDKVIEFCFWIFIYIFKEMNWQNIYSKKFTKMKIMLHSLESRIKERNLSFVLDKIYSKGFGLFEIFSNCFFTLMLNKIKLENSSKFMDFVLFQKEHFLYEFIILHINSNLEKIVSF